MIVLAAAAVRTTGVNWESAGVIIAAVSVLFGMFTFVLTRRDRRNEEQNEEIKREIADSVNRLGERLESKLETKETVARISERLARLEGAAGMPNNQNH